MLTTLISDLGEMRYAPFHVLLRKNADGTRSFMDERFNVILTKPGNIADYKAVRAHKDRGEHDKAELFEPCLGTWGTHDLSQPCSPQPRGRHD